MSLLWDINRYCRRTGMPPTKFGRLAVNDPRFVLDLMNGREPGPATRAKVAAFIERNGE